MKTGIGREPTHTEKQAYKSGLRTLLTTLGYGDHLLGHFYQVVRMIIRTSLAMLDGWDPLSRWALQESALHHSLS